MRVDEDGRPACGLLVRPGGVEEEEIFLPAYVYLAVYFGTLGTPYPSTGRMAIRHNGDTPDRWADLAGIWDVIYYAHRTELWWPRVTVAQHRYEEILNFALWWGLYCSRPPIDRVGSSLDWTSVEEVTDAVP